MEKLDPDVLWEGLACLVSYRQFTGAGSRHALLSPVLLKE